MSAYNYEYFIKDFIQRTRHNLNLINPNNGYDVTQLVNSLFGLIIVPNERYKGKISDGDFRKETLSKLPGYKELQSIIDTLKNDGHLYSTYKKNNSCSVSFFLFRLRNALAHSGDGGILFTPCEEGKDIETIIFFDKTDDNAKEFCVEMNIDIIRKTIVYISTMYSFIDEMLDQEVLETKKEAYEKQIEERRNFLKSGNK